MEESERELNADRQFCFYFCGIAGGPQVSQWEHTTALHQLHQHQDRFLCMGPQSCPCIRMPTDSTSIHGEKKQTNKPKNFTKCRTIILLKSGGSSHFYCHWFVAPVVLLWCFCFKGYKLESWWELPSPCDGLIVQTSTDLSFLGLERFLPSENMHPPWDSCTCEVVLIRIRCETHISSEITSGKYFILSKYLWHETWIWYGSSLANTSQQPVIKYVCRDEWCV